MVQIRGAGIFLIKRPQSLLLGNLSKTFSGSKKQKSYSRMAQETPTNLENFRSEGHSAFVLGYTGGVGKALVEELDKAKLFKKVVLVGRREVPLNVGPEFEQKVVDYEKMEEYKEVFNDLDVGFCCLGTTRGKSGVQGFIRVDHDYVLQAAEVAKGQGCKHFSLVSSGGADKNSSFLYIRIKGQVEEALKVMHFDRLSIYRPGLLICHREDSRLPETIFRTLLKPVTYFFPTALSIPVGILAQAMVNSAVAAPNSDSSFELVDNKTCHRLAGTSKDCNLKRSQSAPEGTKPE